MVKLFNIHCDSFLKYLPQLKNVRDMKYTLIHFEIKIFHWDPDEATYYDEKKVGIFLYCSLPFCPVINECPD